MVNVEKHCKEKSWASDDRKRTFLYIYICSDRGDLTFNVSLGVVLNVTAASTQIYTVSDLY